jgi:hypothetical protein
MQYTQIEALRHASMVTERTRQLLGSPKGNVGRKFRRFLEQVAPNGFMSLLVVRDEEETVDELKRLVAVAEAVHEDCKVFMKRDYIAQDLGVSADASFGMVQVAFVLSLDYKTSSVAELRKAIETVQQAYDALECFIFRHRRVPFDPSDLFDFSETSLISQSLFSKDSAKIASDIIAAAMAGEVAY